MSSEEVWYVFQNTKQIGPFDKKQIQEKLNNKMIAQDAFLFKTGWKDWRPLLDCSEEFNSQEGLKKRPGFVDRDQRAHIEGKIIIHNNGNLIVGVGMDVSKTGMFVKTAQDLFKLGETLKLTCKVEGMDKGFLVQAKVSRRSDDPNLKGYGLQFLDLTDKDANEISQLIEKNEKKAG